MKRNITLDKHKLQPSSTRNSRDSLNAIHSPTNRSPSNNRKSPSKGVINTSSFRSIPTGTNGIARPEVLLIKSNCKFVKRRVEAKKLVVHKVAKAEDEDKILENVTKIDKAMDSSTIALLKSCLSSHFVFYSLSEAQM